MRVPQLHLSRRTTAIAVAFLATVSLAIGAHAALNLRALDAAKAVATSDEGTSSSKKVTRVALIIGNGHYPDATNPLTQPINDARALSASLRHDGFDVDVVEDASRDDMKRAIDRLRGKIRSDSIVLLFFGGYGVQAGRESYMIPVDAAIWKQADVKRWGVSVESVLDVMKSQGARARLVVLDASRRNPYERRFRSYSHGLAPINAPDSTLILSSVTPNEVVDDSKGEHSVLVSELLKNLDNKSLSVDAMFRNTRMAITRASDGQQVPSVSSSLLEDIRLASSDAARGG
jgi:uncharacterized caspase-like protein